MRITGKFGESIVAMAAVLTLSACGGGGDAPSKSDAESFDPLTIGVGNIPTGLNPAPVGLISSVNIMQLIGGTLTELDASGQEVEMVLAESIEEGDNQYVVKLKPGLMFSDGSPLNAEDVAASFNYYLADKNGSYVWPTAGISKVAATDDLTVAFDLSKPSPSLPKIFAMHVAAILPSEAIESRGKDLYTGDPLPTAGEFQVEKFDQHTIVLKANPNYAGTKPSTQTVTFKAITDPVARMSQLASGQLDFADELSPNQVSQLPDDIKTSTTGASVGGELLVMNNRENSVLSDIRIRKALALAVDRNQINDVAWGGLNKVSLGVFGSTSPYQKDLTFLSADADPDGAKKLLVGTECEDGCTLKLLGVTTNQVYGDAAVVVQQNLKDIGIEVNIQNADPVAQGEMMLDGDYDIGLRGNYESLVEPYLEFTVGPTVEGYRTGYENDTMTQLIEEVSTTTGSDRDDAVERLNDQFEQDLPWAPLTDFAFLSGSRVSTDRFSVETGFRYQVG